MPFDLPIDVIIACYNGEPWLVDTMDSIFAQTRRPASIVVVDDGSGDGSVELIAARYPAVCLERTSRRGASGARNHGLRKTESPYVIFMDQDDLWHPRHLEILHGLLQRHPHSALAATSSREFLDGDRPHFDTRREEPRMFDPWLTYPSHGFNCIPAVSLFRRRPLEEIGACPEDHEPMPDYSLWMRLSMTRPIPVSQACSAAHRRHGKSHTARLTSDRLGYSETCLRVDRDLLDGLSSCPGVSEARKKQAGVRYRMAIGFHEFAKSPLVATAEQRSTIADIDAALAAETPPYRRAFLRHFVAWMPYERFDPAAICTALLDRWPVGATKNELESVIAERLPAFPDLWRFLDLGASFSPHRLRVTVRTLARRAMARLRRCLRSRGRRER